LSKKFIVSANGEVYVVWKDDTNGPWGNDVEIMYAKFIPGDGWINAPIISDGFNDIFWNDGESQNPSLAVSDDGTVHVVWDDDVTGSWGTDREILYAKYVSGSGWSNVSVISDGFEGTYWNTGFSLESSIAVSMEANIHVAWDDNTAGPWGSDFEIMYVKYTP
jgi:hypothetical protein